MQANKKRIPQTAEWLLGRILPKADQIQINGSFEQLYEHKRNTKGSLHAGLWIWKEIFRSLPGFISAALYWKSMMLKNTFAITLRTIKKHTLHSLINLTGLSIGMAVCLLMLLWTSNELSFDKFHADKDEIAQVYSQIEYSNGRTQIFMGSYYPLAKFLKSECPEVKEAARYESTTGIHISHEDKRFTNDKVGLVDPSFFRIFSFPFIQGDPETAMEENYSVILTEKMAWKYFGNEDPIGKILTIENQMDLQVTGIIQNVPSQSSLQFDCLVPFVIAFAPEFKEPEHWGGNPLETYVLLHKESTHPLVEQKITAIVENHMQSETIKVNFHLHPLAKKHLYSPQGGGRIQPLVIFSAIAFFVWLIACFNFMNLSTAKAATRAKEVGTRKIVGARRSDLIWQFSGEAVLISLFALVFAVILLAGFLPLFTDILNTQLSLGLLLSPLLVCGCLGIALLTGIVSGVYPALYLAALQPGNILKGPARTGMKSGLRKILVVVQFSLSIIMIICTLVVLKQYGFIMSTDLGFERENLVVVQMSQGLQDQYEPFRNDLQKNPQILDVTRSLQGPWNIGSTVGAVEWDGKPPDETVNMHWDNVGYDYFQTLDMKIILGRAFSREYSTDRDEAYIVNETAVKLMGMESPIGKRLAVFRNEGKIIGIVKDFHFQSFHHAIKPFIFMLRPNSGSLAFVRIRPENLTGTLDYIGGTVSRHAPDAAGDPRMFNEILTNYVYSSEKQAGRTAGYFALLAVSLSCLGLFGLASFMAERRTKEIGIRKVVGATTKEMAFMLTKDFTRWVLLSNLFAWPAAYLIQHKFLEQYAQRTTIGAEIYILPSLAAMVIAILTVSYQTVRAAHANPADTLRTE